MTQFDWKTDGDEAWNEGEWLEAPMPPRQRRRWPMLLLVALLLSVASFLIYDQIDERVNEVTADVTDDLMSSYTLMWYAAAQGDAELFDTLLSGRDAQWTEIQRQLFVKGAILDRAFLGMRIVDIESQLADIEAGLKAPTNIQFSPDLLEAEITMELPFEIMSGNGGRENLILRHSTVFRRGRERWLLAPPGEEYWDARVREERAWLSIDYPKRDAAVAERLGHELNEQLGQLCEVLPDLNCAAELQVDLHLDTDPAELLVLTQPDEVYASGLRLTLPAISLVGLPVDEAGYQAIYHAYARYLIAAVVSHLVDWECCDQALYFEALLAHQLAQMGLYTWPINAADYARLIDQGIFMEELTRIWLSPDQFQLGETERLKVFALVDFLLDAFPEQSSVTLQRELATRRTLGQWLSRLYTDLINQGENMQVITLLQDAWRQFAYSQTTETQGQSPIPLPLQQIQLGCYPDGNFDTTHMYRYQPAARQWTEFATQPGTLISMVALPEDKGTILSTSGESERWRTTLWRDESGTNLFAAENPVLSLGQVDPTGRYVLGYAIDVEGDFLSRPVLADLASCELGSCDSIPVLGPAVWSPDGRQTLSTDIESLGQVPLIANGRIWWFQNRVLPEEWRLYRGNQRVQSDDLLNSLVDLGTGVAPFWLDESNYGYLRNDRPSAAYPAQELVIASILDDVPQVLLTSAELKEKLAYDDGSLDWWMLAATASPVDSNLLFLYISIIGQEDNALLISLDRRTGQIRTRFETPSLEFGSLGFSPDGRWLLVTSPDSRQQTVGEWRNTLYLHDIERNQTQRFLSYSVAFPMSWTYDWSADGQWLAMVADENILALIAPDYEFQQYLLHELGDCTAIAWITP